AVAVAVSVGRLGGGIDRVVGVLVGGGITVKMMTSVGACPTAGPPSLPRPPCKKRKVPTKVHSVTKTKIRPATVINKVLSERWLTGATAGAGSAVGSHDS